MQPTARRFFERIDDIYATMNLSTLSRKVSPVCITERVHAFHSDAVSSWRFSMLTPLGSLKHGFFTQSESLIRSRCKRVNREPRMEAITVRHGFMISVRMLHDVRGVELRQWSIGYSLNRLISLNLIASHVRGHRGGTNAYSPLRVSSAIITLDNIPVTQLRAVT